MKTGAFKILSMARVAIYSSLLLFALNGRTQDRAGEVSALRGRPGSNEHFKKYAAEVDHQKAKIEGLKETIRHDRKAGRKETARVERKNLKKEKADLRSDELYLMTDSRGITKGDRSTIRKCKQAIREDKINLRESRRSLRKARSKDEAVSVRIQTVHVAFYEQRLAQDKDQLSFERRKKKDDLAFTRKQTKGSRGRRMAL